MAGVVEPVSRTALDGVSDGVVVFAPDWTIRYVNPAGAAVLDRSVEDVVGATLWDVFPEAVGTAFHTHLLDVAANPPSDEPVSLAGYDAPTGGRFHNQAWRVGDEVVIVYVREDELRVAEAERQRLSAQVQEALARSQVLLTASEAFTAATTMTEIAEAVARLVDGTAGSPAYADMALIEPDGRHLARLRTEAMHADVRDRYGRVPLTADMPPAESARTGRAVVIENLDQLAERYPAVHADWAAEDRQAIACAPVPGPDGPVGTLVFVWPRPHPMDVTERAMIMSIAGYAGQAVTRLRTMEQRLAEVRGRYEDTRAAMAVMQRSLLPATLPVLPGLRIGAHYRPADSEHAAGGDWFDAIPVGPGRVALVVGDVVGHGAAAAAVMGQLRAVLAGFLTEGADVLESLARLDRFATRVPGARGATAWVGVLDTAELVLSSASSGHPPPMIVTAPVGSLTLPLTVGGPLGLPGPAPVLAEARLQAGDLLLCYSDGLVERPGRTLDDGFASLGDVAVGAVRDHGRAPDADALDRICASIVDRVTRGGQHDDATLLAVSTTGSPVEPLSLDVASDDRGALRRVRHGLGGWLGAVGAGDDDVVDLNLAVGEAVANSIEHAYRDGPGPVCVEAVLGDDGRVSVTIIDRGRWLEPRTERTHRRRGLALMHHCVDDVEIESLAQGTVVSFDRELRRTPVWGSTSDIGRAPVEEVELRIATAPDGEPVAVVSGPVDMVTVGYLRDRLMDIGRGGLLPLSVDLVRVTHLGSAGIALLYEIAEDMVHAGHTLRLVAPSGSPAGQAVRLSGLDAITVLSGGPSAAPAGVS